MNLSDKILEKLQSTPNKPGCYLLRDIDGKIIYIGKAKELKKRLQFYFRPSSYRNSHLKNRSLIKSISSFDYIVVKSEAESILLEGNLIKEHQPYYNILWKDDKRFVNIKIDVQRPFPTISTCRIRKKDGSIYFGPYINSYAAKVAVDFIQRFFGLKRCTDRIPNDISYRHCNDDIIANCSAPCIKSISNKSYRNNVQEAIAFLKGERIDMFKNIREEMNNYSSNQNYEKAAAYRDLLQDLQKTVKSRVNLKRTPKMSQSISSKGLHELKIALDLKSLPLTIECFDISNISGTSSVGSMVVLKNGIPKPNLYRKYKIKSVNGIDDPASMAEVVSRRYNRLLRIDANMPNLIIVDGGITQLRAAHMALVRLNLGDIKIVGLAKKYEEIIWDIKNNSSSIRLTDFPNALEIITHLRDEAHRFAINFHRSLRSKRVLSSQLDEISGIGAKKKKDLLNHFGSISRIKKSSIEELVNVNGIGSVMAKVILEELNKNESS